jgi:signal transduction histidine kinase
MIEWLTRKEQNTNLSSKGAKEADFLSLATHDLRTPMSIIKWYTEMLLDGDGGSLTEDQTKYLRVIQSSNQRAIDLVKSLLNVSRLDLGTFGIYPTQVNLREIVDQVLLEDKDRITEKRLQIEVVQNIADVVTSTDKQFSTVIIRNLILNAVLFSFKETKITITLDEVSEKKEVAGKAVEPGVIVVTINDHGIGIPETDKEKIFSKLFRASNVKDENGEGSGLGLYVVKTATLALKGDVWFTSLPDGSTTFYLALHRNGLEKKEGRTTLD